jgi:Sec-independent protein translocase protein TatA
VALIVLGPSRLPEAGRQVGKALAEVRRWTQEVKNEVSTAFDGEAITTPPPEPTPYAVAPPEPVAPADPLPAAPPPAPEAPTATGTWDDDPEPSQPAPERPGLAPAPRRRLSDR